ncbi:uncharacterized protein PFL1_04701 [Pseudozyma flocculosa PF-1]|uniref:Short-chain dehydrogenase n=2 Tax=Pseudozyma flocculosa TaxID=84751 RepID=A0A5C3F4C4_9BASI|nr:uncharacterized protein PFL1_04701 [Pseudozyma flocculosa PF-1]EPQ27563.1 hypothetical protein PFL1_04701 [Pseudozyma flocculosa PF-1]SPO39308.1 uncharacterized protein PSFLO_04789 [Pseudozyma flocculosa]
MPPSVFDTHCDGPGLLPTTVPWSRLYSTYRRFCCDVHSDIPIPTPSSAPGHDLRGKTVIISGSNSGIGKEAALHFLECGATVILACRLTATHEQHPEETRSELLTRTGADADRVEVWEVDCSSLASVRAFGQRWHDSGRTCDILVNNAGLSPGKRIITDEGFELTQAVNFLSHTLITFYVLPSMRYSAAPRIVNTCSCFHAGGQLDFANFNNEKHTPGGQSGVQWYCDTKLRLLMWTVELQERLSRSDDYRHVIAHGVHPGFVGSNIWNNPNFQLTPLVTPLLRRLISRFSITPRQGAFVLIHAALCPDLGLPNSDSSTASPLDDAKHAGANGGDVANGGKREKAKQPSPGLSAKFGGKYVNRNIVDIRRPECDDILARSRLWQRVLEDTKAEQLGLAKDLPGHLPEILAFK